MRSPKFTLLAVLALVVAACGEAAEDSTTTNPSEPEVEAVQLSYSLDPGSSYQYEVELDQTIDLITSGDTGAMGAGEDVPDEMSLEVRGTTLFTQAIADGPEPGTYEVTITGDFSDMEFGGTIDGEPVESADIPDIAEMEPVDVTILVDEQGNVIPDDNGGLGQDFFGDLGGLGMLDQFGSGVGPGQFIGPPFSEDEVTVGDTWSDTVEIPMMLGQDPVTTQIDSEVVSTETIDGNEVFVIETTNSTSAIEMDLAELLVGFMSGFAPEELSEEEQAEMDAMIEQLRFVFSIDPQVSELTTWFDYEAGLARQAEFSSNSHMVMDLNVPDDTTGELTELSMDMDITQDITYRLTGSGSA